MLTEATADNLARKAKIIDPVQWIDGAPAPKWIELSLTELCNRSAGSPKACRFCPRIDPKFYPNQDLSMSVGLVAKIADELRSIAFQGAVVLCGFGEPLLHPDLVAVVAALRGLRVEIVTNGDRLNVERIRALSGAGCRQFVVSMYDGEHQRATFKAMFAAAGCVDYVLRDRWHSEDDDFGLKLTNRAGAVTVGNQPAVDASRPCFYPAYSMQIDWNGDVLLCPQLWDKKLKFGNLHQQTIMDVWRSSALHKRRMRLLKGRAGLSGCEGCNTEGTCHGADHAAAWETTG